MPLPTKEEINIYNSLDEETASKHYYGKTLTEIEELFREYGLAYCQDLMWMGPIAFSYYLTSAYEYLKSDFAKGDADVINCLASVIEYRWGEKDFNLATNKVKDIINYVINQYNKFDVDIEIYGNLMNKYKKFLVKIG